MDFSLLRLWLLVKKTWLENQKTYAIAIGAMAGLIAILAIAIAQSNMSNSSASGVLFIGMLFLGALFSSMLLRDFSDGSAKKQVLMLPVTASERLASALIYGLGIFPLIYLTLAYPVCLIVKKIDIEYLGGDGPLLEPGVAFMKIYPFFLFFQSFVLLFSVVFKHNALVKTTVLMCVLIFSSFYLQSKIADYLMDLRGVKEYTLTKKFHDENGKIERITVQKHKESLIESRGWVILGKQSFFKADGGIVEVELSDHQQQIFNLFSFLIVPFLWIIAWFRLKETQL